jgi:hypothetical protein
MLLKQNLTLFFALFAVSEMIQALTPGNGKQRLVTDI